MSAPSDARDDRTLRPCADCVGLLACVAAAACRAMVSQLELRRHQSSRVPSATRSATCVQRTVTVEVPGWPRARRGQPAAGRARAATRWSCAASHGAARRARRARHELRLDYQVFLSPPQPRTLEMPPLHAALQGPAARAGAARRSLAGDRVAAGAGGGVAAARPGRAAARRAAAADRHARRALRLCAYAARRAAAAGVPRPRVHRPAVVGGARIGRSRWPGARCAACRRRSREPQWRDACKQLHAALNRTDGEVLFEHGHRPLRRRAAALRAACATTSPASSSGRGASSSAKDDAGASALRDRLADRVLPRAAAMRAGSCVSFDHPWLLWLLPLAALPLLARVGGALGNTWIALAAARPGVRAAGLGAARRRRRWRWPRWWSAWPARTGPSTRSSASARAPRSCWCSTAAAAWTRASPARAARRGRGAAPAPRRWTTTSAQPAGCASPRARSRASCWPSSPPSARTTASRMIVFSTLPIRVLGVHAEARGDPGRDRRRQRRPRPVGDQHRRSRCEAALAMLRGPALHRLAHRDAGVRRRRPARPRRPRAHRPAARKHRVAIYWLYLRSAQQPGADARSKGEAPASVETRARDCAAPLLRIARDAVSRLRGRQHRGAASRPSTTSNRLENLPITYLDTMPRRDLSRRGAMARRWPACCCCWRRTWRRSGDGPELRDAATRVGVALLAWLLVARGHRRRALPGGSSAGTQLIAAGTLPADGADRAGRRCDSRRPTRRPPAARSEAALRRYRSLQGDLAAGPGGALQQRQPVDAPGGRAARRRRSPARRSR